MQSVFVGVVGVVLVKGKCATGITQLSHHGQKVVLRNKERQGALCWLVLGVDQVSRVKLIADAACHLVFSHLLVPLRLFGCE